MSRDENQNKKYDYLFELPFKKLKECHFYQVLNRNFTEKFIIPFPWKVGPSEVRNEKVIS